MTQFNPDQPITRFGEDRLHRSAFAKSIAKGFETWTHNSASVVVALYGTWGSGKTSIANLVKAKLLEDGWQESQFIEFNPWIYKNAEQIAEQFFGEISKALGHQKTKKSELAQSKWNLWAKFTRAGGVLTSLAGGAVAATGHPDAGASLIASKLLTDKAAEGMEALAKVEEFSSETSSPTLQCFRNELVAALASLEKPIIVLIDDVDRLSAAEIRLLFQLIKANSDFPNLGFMVMCQRNIVEESLSELMPKSLEEKFPVGRYYLDKIVHVGLNLPELGDDSLHSELDRAIRRIPEVANHQWLHDNDPLKVIRPYFKTPRQIIRFQSSLSFQIGLFTENEVLTICLEDLILLEALRLHEPEVFAGIPFRRTQLRSSSNIDYLESLGRKESSSECRSALRQLFPSQRPNDEFLAEQKRVCLDTNFSKYFCLEKPLDDSQSP